MTTAAYKWAIVIAVVMFCIAVCFAVCPTIVAHRFKYHMGRGNCVHVASMFNSPAEFATSTQMVASQVTVAPLTIRDVFRGERRIFVEIPAGEGGMTSDWSVQIRSDLLGLNFIYALN